MDQIVLEKIKGARVSWSSVLTSIFCFSLGLYGVFYLQNQGWFCIPLGVAILIYRIYEANQKITAIVREYDVSSDGN